MKELKKKLLKAKKFKFIRNVCVSLVALILVALIINIAPGYKRDKYKDITNLIINEENKTEELKHNIYINENNTVYISEEDVKNLFDDNILSIQLSDIPSVDLVIHLLGIIRLI